jgi:hypothetical protein
MSLLLNLSAVTVYKLIKQVENTEGKDIQISSILKKPGRKTKNYTALDYLDGNIIEENCT